jgi:hypothetical protein
VRLTDKQIALYKAFRDGIDLENASRRLLPDSHIFLRISTHPYLLIEHARAQENKVIVENNTFQIKFVCFFSD